MANYIGIDLGTTGLKTVVLNAAGTILGTGYREYPIETPEPNHAQQDPHKWWSALCATVKEAMTQSSLSPGDVAGIGLSGQMHGAVFLDESCQLLAPAIIWCDQRSSEELKWIQSVVSPAELQAWIQNPVATGFQVCSLLWLRSHHPEIFEKTRHVLLPKDYLRYRLTGNIGSEASDACSTALYNCAEFRWSTEMLNRLSLDPALLPDAQHISYETAGTLSREAADDLGLSAGITVAYGGGDQPMQALGNGVLYPGDAMITLGTGGQIFVPTDSPCSDPLLRSHLFCHADKNTWYVLGAILNCCLAQNWFFEQILESSDYAGMHTAASEIPPGSNNLFFLPYLTGERTPHMDPNAKGVFWGLTLRHNRASMIRAVVEGISFSLYEAGLSLNINWQNVNRLIVTGGGSRSLLWRQILADLFDRPIYTTNTTEAACVGAAICAMVADKEYSSLSEACGSIVSTSPVPVHPVASSSSVYHDRFALFCQIYQANKALFGTVN